MSLAFYKKGQGYYTRLGTAVGGGIMAVFGSWSLYKRLSVLEGYMPEKTNLARWLQAGIPALLLVVLAWVIFKIVNKQKYADFMIATEGEMKKVSWSTRKEIITSTKVVIVTVFLMAAILASIDLGFSWLFHKIGILKAF